MAALGEARLQLAATTSAPKERKTAKEKFENSCMHACMLSTGCSTHNSSSSSTYTQQQQRHIHTQQQQHSSSTQQQQHNIQRYRKKTQEHTGKQGTPHSWAGAGQRPHPVQHSQQLPGRSCLLGTRAGRRHMTDCEALTSMIRQGGPADLQTCTLPLVSLTLSALLPT